VKIDGISFDIGKKITDLDPTQQISGNSSLNSLTSSNLDVDLESMIKDGIEKLDEPQKVLNTKIGNFLMGNEQLHNVMIASEEAKFAMNFSVKVRDKVIDAYHTIMRMQV
jgi:flagellar hook-basal body complex protein FliE